MCDKGSLDPIFGSSNDQPHDHTRRYLIRSATGLHQCFVDMCETGSGCPTKPDALDTALWVDHAHELTVPTDWGLHLTRHGLHVGKQMLIQELGKLQPGDPEYVPVWAKPGILVSLDRYTRLQWIQGPATEPRRVWDPVGANSTATAGRTPGPGGAVVRSSSGRDVMVAVRVVRGELDGLDLGARQVTSANDGGAGLDKDGLTVAARRQIGRWRLPNGLGLSVWLISPWRVDPEGGPAGLAFRLIGHNLDV
ncbi:hypothetical protein BGZ61DRAFT_486116 [Ilyonectria robusta]|uniref:uncharacterized protein n=1 Tax=Ilyonectria robusta TaxID=1079257 RepID=UPI001E8E2F42|nr:uncharacterized protein BGZ61DRAFT_486116 [Ilyonectria robusta]KAH8658935.1 hypothetical protein BGZ61DRAFT_486116 [Ilyonectria robusta]